MADSKPETAPQPQLPAAGADEVALTIDGRPVVVRKGTTVLQAAASIGVHVPHYCYHPGLSIAGNCRMCLVEIEKVPKLQIGCATTVSQGMAVKTTTDRVKTTREGIMEFLLINHPLDCPICDQAGECRLQQYEADYGAGFSRFVEEKVHWPKRCEIGPRVVFDAERCIKCTRCIRFTDEISKSHELALFQRGDHAIIGTFPGRPLNDPYSGNTVDVCPVGALTWKDFRFKARVWFLKDVASACAGCARGCSVNLATYRNRIHRITPRHNPEVNDYWICDAGRESHRALYDRPRLESAWLSAARGVAPQPAGFDEALDRAAERLREVIARHGARALGAIVSARLTLEDLHIAHRVLGRAIGVPRMAVPPHLEGQDDPLLVRRDKTPNARGAALAGPGAPDAGRLKELYEEIAAGRIKALVVIGEDPLGDGVAGAIPAIDAAALGTLETLVVLDAWRTPTVEAADVALPITAYAEAEGVYVNFEGRAQRAAAAVKPAGEALPAWRVLLDLGLRFGHDGGHASAARVFDEAAASIPALAGLSYRALGSLGAPVKEG